MPQVVLAPGLNIACIYAKKWHRGLIKKVKPDGYVVVSDKSSFVFIMIWIYFIIMKIA